MGSSASFTCITNDSSAIRWTHLYSTTGKLATVYNGHKIRQELSDKYVVINTSFGLSHLTIKNIQINDTGNLSCYEAHTDNQRYSFELRVLGKNILYMC